MIDMMIPEIGVDIIGVPTDSAFSLAPGLTLLADKGGVADLKYPLAADATKNVSRD